MGVFQDQLRAQQKKVQDLLTNQDQAIEPNIQKSQDLVSGMRPSFQSGASDILGSVGAQYGLNPGIVQSGLAAQSKTLQNTDRANSEFMDRARMAQKARVRNLTYNTLFDNFVNAGNDLNEASMNARNIALSQQGYDAQAKANDEARMNLIARNNINRSYAAQAQAAAQNVGDPYEQAVTSSLMQAGVQAPLAYYLYKGNQNPMSNNSVSKAGPVAGQNGTMESMYDKYYNADPFGPKYQPKSQVAGIGGYYGE